MRTKPGLSLGLLAAVLGAALLPAAPAPTTNVHITKAPGRLDFRCGERLATSYHLGKHLAKPYFWPVNTPDGLPITRGWPMDQTEKDTQTDHVHQKSAWFCHGDVIPEGFDVQEKIKGVKGVDFWSEAKGHGRIVSTKVGPVEETKNHAKVATHNEWRTAGGKKVLDEERTIHFYDLGDAQLLVLDIDLEASVVPITFGDTKEGSLGVRVQRSVTEDKGKGHLTNADGHTGEGRLGNVARTGCWGLVSAWCDYSGPVGGKVGGITIFADPSNPYATCWHARGYGLMAANPFGRAKSGFPAMKGKTKLVRLAKGEHLKLRYGLLLHRGDVKAGKVAEHYKQFVKLRGEEK